LETLTLIFPVLNVQVSNERVDLRVLEMFSQETFQFTAGIRKKDLIDKFYGRCRAFDVEEYYADLSFVKQGYANYFAAGCGRMYPGPKQTGS
jgi:hypothetical protein